jgi:thiamine biosynthesis lipoprotein
MGTWVAIEARAPLATNMQAGLEAAMAAVDRVDKLMHPTRDGSDLSRISGAKPGTRIAVDAWTIAVLRQSAELNVLTHGLFDPCVAREPGRITDIDLHEPDAVTCNVPVAVDLGGIAKGFAVDQAIEALQAHECSAGLVNVGGDLRVFGAEPRLVHVRTSEDQAVQVDLVNAALAASGPRTSASPSEHLGHYLGTTGVTVEGQHVAVVAPQAMVADALCKCALLCASSVFIELLGQYSAQLIQRA